MPTSKKQRIEPRDHALKRIRNDQSGHGPGATGCLHIFCAFLRPKASNKKRERRGTNHEKVRQRELINKLSLPDTRIQRGPIVQQIRVPYSSFNVSKHGLKTDTLKDRLHGENGSKRYALEDCSSRHTWFTKVVQNTQRVTTRNTSNQHYT